MVDPSSQQRLNPSALPKFRLAVFWPVPQGIVSVVPAVIVCHVTAACAPRTMPTLARTMQSFSAFIKRLLADDCMYYPKNGKASLVYADKKSV